MRVNVLAFGILRDLPGVAAGPIDLPAGATVRDLIESFRAQAHQGDATAPLWSSIAVAVNREYASGAHELAEGDEVALLPPVSGGSASLPSATAPPATHPWVALTNTGIDSATLAGSLKRGEDGAVVVFDGIVRNHTRDRRTLHLFYEAYPEMALKQMRQIAEQALTDFPIRDVCIVHRLGRLEIGETSVLIAVASAHRAAAFDACRWIIDTLKRTVPIWKKEFFEDGVVWAQGDPFPARLKPEAGVTSERIR